MTSESLTKASHVVFIFTCLALVSLAGVRVWTEWSASSAATPAGAGPIAQEKPLAPSAKVSALDGISYDKSPLTVAVVVQSHCPYCAASIPFYQKLSKMRGSSGFQFVAASFEPLDTTRGYLKEHGVDVDAIAALKGPEIPTTGTPTLVLIGKGGIVLDSWLGQLSASQEADVTARIAAAIKKAA